MALQKPILTDKYQLTMAQAYWRTGNYRDQATFEMFFRKNPFGGEFTIFGGLTEALNVVKNFKYTDDDCDYLLSVGFDPEFVSYLKTLDCSEVVIKAQKEGSVVFPRCPVMVVSGPLIVCQLLETTLLNCCNFASLIATNAARMKLRSTSTMVEFGLRRAQGPDGGMTASKYSYIGGFDGTSNVLAGKEYNIPIFGTHAHSFVEAFSGPNHVLAMEINGINLYKTAVEFLKSNNVLTCNMSELSSFVAYASTFPDSFLALIDTYDTVSSGIHNFCAVAYALANAGHRAIGIRLDSGDLAYLSNTVREIGKEYAINSENGMFAEVMNNFTIVASNDINEDVLISLEQQGHSIDMFGVGTNLVTCQKQPALGMVYKLVEINGRPRIKLSEQIRKITIPGSKNLYRLYIESDKGPQSVVDLIATQGDDEPVPGKRVLVRHPFEEQKRAYVSPIQVENLLNTVWNGQEAFEESIEVVRNRCIQQIKSLREDYLRSHNPTPYKVSVTEAMYRKLHSLWLEEKPVVELS